VLRHELAGLVIHALDISLKLSVLDSPLAATADLDGFELPGTHQRIGLGRGDVEHLRNIGQGEKARLRHSHSLTSSGPRKGEVIHSLVKRQIIWGQV